MIPGDGGWWKSSGLEAFHRLYDDMLAWNIPPHTAAEWLSDAYNAVREEYGD